MASEALAEAVSAGMGGAFSSSALYPIEIAKNRLQATKKPSAEEEKEAAAAGNKLKAPTMSSVAADLYRSEGMGGFYKGFQYSAMQSATEKSIYFYGYTFIVKGWTAAFGGDPSAMGGVLCGCLAEWVHLPVTLPIDAITVRIQTGDGFSNPIRILRQLLREGGVTGLYSGWTAYIVLCLKPAITYALFDFLKKYLLAQKKKKGQSASSLTALEAFVVGAIARGVATIAVFPYTRAKVIVKSTKAVEGKAPPTIAGTVAQIIRDEGFLSLYQGCAPEVGRGVLSAALMLMAKEKINMAVRKALGVRTGAVAA